MMGATDGSETLLDELVIAVPCCTSRAFGPAIMARQQHLMRGFEQANGELIATMDGDLQYDPNDFAKLLPLVESI